MKILMANRWFYPYLGGVEFHILNLSRQLISQGHEVHVVCMYKDQSLPEQEQFKGIMVHRVKSRSAVAELMKKEGYDACHFHMPRNLFAAFSLFAARKMNMRTVFTPHCFYPGGGPLKVFMKYLCDKSLSFLMLRKSDFTISLTPADKAVAMKHGLRESQSRIIPNSISFEELGSVDKIDFCKKYDIHRPFLLHVGRFCKVKNIDFLVNQHTALADRFDLVLIGQDEGELPGIRKIIADKDLGKSVYVIEKAPFPDICSAYHEAALTVMASSSEGLPTVLLESLFFETPIASSNVGGIPYLMQGKGFGRMFELGNGEQYVKAVNEAVEISDQEMSDWKQEVYEQYSWEKNSMKVVELYGES